MTTPAPKTTQEQYDDFKSGYAAGYHDATINEGGGNRLFKTPDITPAQVVAVAGAALAVAAAFGFDISQDSKDSIMQLVSVLAATLLVGDAAIRHGRATGSAKKDG